MNNHMFRVATISDVDLILTFIKELATYERMLDEVTATTESLKEWLFEKKAAEVMFVMDNDIEVGYAIYFYNFSTFTGKAGLYIEDLYVKPDYRSKGYGKAILKELAKIASDSGCERMEWVCLDWNKPSIDFYLSIKAKPLKNWTIFRLEEVDIENLVK